MLKLILPHASPCSAYLLIFNLFLSTVSIASSAMLPRHRSHPSSPSAKLQTLRKPTNYSSVHECIIHGLFSCLQECQQYRWMLLIDQAHCIHLGIVLPVNRKRAGGARLHEPLNQSRGFIVTTISTRPFNFCWLSDLLACLLTWQMAGWLPFLLAGLFVGWLACCLAW